MVALGVLVTARGVSSAPLDVGVHRTQPVENTRFDQRRRPPLCFAPDPDLMGHTRMSELYTVDVLNRGAQWVDFRVTQCHPDAGAFPESPGFALQLLLDQAYQFDEAYQRVPAGPLGEAVPVDDFYDAELAVERAKQFIDSVQVYKVVNAPFVEKDAHAWVDRKVLARGIARESDECGTCAARSSKSRRGCKRSTVVHRPFCSTCTAMPAEGSSVRAVARWQRTITPEMPDASPLTVRIDPVTAKYGSAAGSAENATAPSATEPARGAPATHK